MNARFGGVPRELIFPVNAVVGIYARENGAGMEFAYEPTVQAGDEPAEEAPDLSAPASPSLKAVESPSQQTSPSAKPGRPHLQRIK